jgi:hypothetical protein
MLSNEAQVREARSFSEEMALAKDKLVPDMEEKQDDKTPF